VAQSLARVKRRISAVESTRKITNSMKLVSSVKLRKMNKIVTLQAFYFRAMERALSDAIFYNNLNDECKYDSPFIKENESATKNLYILVTSNMGLCGAYNNEIVNFFKIIYKKGDEVLIIGEKGYLNLLKEDIPLDTNFLNLRHDFSLRTTKLLTDYLMKKYLKGNYKKISLIYSKYKNSIAFIPSEVILLPLTPKQNVNAIYSPIYEPSKKDVIETIIPQYLNSLIYGNLYSAFLSEESSRRNSMDAADKSAKDLVEKLKLEYNKARQQEITQEITEVVNGSKAVQ
jgi:F-type H+-transporting ATPase subunit gamma